MVQAVNVRDLETAELQETAQLVVAERRPMGRVSKKRGRVINVGRGQGDHPARFDQPVAPLENPSCFVKGYVLDHLERADEIVRSLHLVDPQKVMFSGGVDVAGPVLRFGPQDRKPAPQRPIARAKIEDRPGSRQLGKYRVIALGQGQ